MKYYLNMQSPKTWNVYSVYVFIPYCCTYWQEIFNYFTFLNFSSRRIFSFVILYVYLYFLSFFQDKFKTVENCYFVTLVIMSHVNENCSKLKTIFYKHWQYLHGTLPCSYQTHRVSVQTHIVHIHFANVDAAMGKKYFILSPPEIFKVKSVFFKYWTFPM